MIRIFNSFEEQENFHRELMLRSDAKERFRKLYFMQQMSIMLHPSTDKSRKIKIRKWTS